MKFAKLKLLTGVFSALILFSLTSCEDSFFKPVADPVIQMKTAELGSQAGDMFLSVQTEEQWTLELFFGDQDPWAELSTTEGTGNKNNVIFSYKENTADQPRMLEIYLLTSSGKGVFQKVTQAGASGTVPENPDKPTDPDPDQPENPQKPENFGIQASWLELPAQNDKNLYYVAHHYENNGKKYRNYSIGFSEKDVVAIWVAYPLCKSYLGSIRRTDAWNYDPILGSKLSPAPFGGYGDDPAQGIYRDRGHLLPSGSRTCCVAANEQTFYGSNMAPQIGKGFNQSIWGVLEDKVRKKAASVDTMYVVTGCVLEGSTRKLKDSDGKMITEPTAFYKAVLSYHKNSTYSKWMGAAFYLEHKVYPGQAITKDMSMSIDDLEKKTGLDFFPNLIDKIGKEEADKVEKQNPQNVAFWW